jgi:MerR family transcriptional regulator, heat shock protein HspR
VKKEKGRYLIGEVAKRVGIHDQTIREYERRGLLSIQRSPAGYRFFAEEDVARITVIVKLTEELGLNLAGVKMTMELVKRLKMTMDELLDFIDDHEYDFSVKD